MEGFTNLCCLEDKRDGGEGSPTEETGLNGGEIEVNGKTLSAEVIDDDDDWAPEPVIDQLNSNIGKLIIDKDLDKSVEERLDMLHQYFVKAKENNSLGDGKQLLNEAERLELKNKAPLLLAQVLLTKDIMNDLKNHRILFLRFTLEDKKAQRWLLGGIEQFIQKDRDFLPRASHIVKTLYDLDLCTEEAILSWGKKV